MQDVSQRRQCAKAQARKQARAFKSLDTTVHVLGIQAKQGEQDGAGEPVEGSRAAAKLHQVLSVASRCRQHPLAPANNGILRTADSPTLLHHDACALPCNKGISIVMQHIVCPAYQYTSLCQNSQLLCSDTSEAGGRSAQPGANSQPQRVPSGRRLEVQAQAAAPRTPTTPTYVQGIPSQRVFTEHPLAMLPQLRLELQHMCAMVSDVHHCHLFLWYLVARSITCSCA